jgi:transposase
MAGSVVSLLRHHERPREGLPWSSAGRSPTGRLGAEIEPLLPREGGERGGQWRDHRTVIDGILWKLRTGSPWRNLPERYGPWQTCFDRFNRWRRDGSWDRLLTHAQANSGAVWDVEWEVSVDDTVIRAHQRAAGARREPAKNEGDAKGGS